VLSADTIVEFEGQILGKPADRQDAERILEMLRGRRHRVYTAISLIDYSTSSNLERLVESDVLMRDYSETELLSYLDSGNWHDKAGAYAIQDPNFAPCESYEGSYTNIMGLPVEEVAQMLIEAGFDIRENLLQRVEDSLGSTFAQKTKVIDENNA
jgi:MAF protein